MPGDIPNIVRLAGSYNIYQNTENIPHPYSEMDAVYWLNTAYQGVRDGTHYVLAIRLNTDDALIGAISLKGINTYERAVLGYWLAEPFWNNGYMTEAAQRVIRFGFEDLQLNKIYATHLAYNPASGKVMAKCGMKWEGKLKQHIKKENQFVDLVFYGVTREEYALISTKN